MKLKSFIIAVHAGTEENSHADKRPLHAARTDKGPGGGAGLDLGHPTVLIHRLNAGSSRQQLLDRLLQTATSRQVERTDTHRVKHDHVDHF